MAHQLLPRLEGLLHVSERGEESRAQGKIQLHQVLSPMAHFEQSDDYRRDELIHIIERSVEKLTLQELEALYYDMSTRSYIND